MPFEKMRAAVAPAGKLIKVRLDNLPGQPEIEMEHLGETNASWMADQAARAGTKDALVLGASLDRVASQRERKQQLLRYRETLEKHAVRHLTDVRHDDGTKATDDQIAEWVDALPDDMVYRLISVAFNVENWREVPTIDAKVLAEK